MRSNTLTRVSNNPGAVHSTIPMVSTLTCTMRRIAEIGSLGSSNHPLGSLTMPLSLSYVIR